jgi:hypothetical protein
MRCNLHSSCCGYAPKCFRSSSCRLVHSHPCRWYPEPLDFDSLDSELLEAESSPSESLSSNSLSSELTTAY